MFFLSWHGQVYISPLILYVARILSDFFDFNWILATYNMWYAYLLLHTLVRTSSAASISAGRFPRSQQRRWPRPFTARQSETGLSELDRRNVSALGSLPANEKADEHVQKIQLVEMDGLFLSRRQRFPDFYIRFPFWTGYNSKVPEKAKFFLLLSTSFWFV